MVKLTNISKSGQLLVCDLNSEETPTLRLAKGESMTVKDSAITKHIERLIAKGHLSKTQKPDEPPVVAKTVIEPVEAPKVEDEEVTPTPSKKKNANKGEKKEE